MQGYRYGHMTFDEMEGEQLSQMIESGRSEAEQEEEVQTEERANQAGNTTDYTKTAKTNRKTEYIHTQCSTPPFRSYLSGCSYF